MRNILALLTLLASYTFAFAQHHFEVKDVAIFPGVHLTQNFIRSHFTFHFESSTCTLHIEEKNDGVSLIDEGYLFTFIERNSLITPKYFQYQKIAIPIDRGEPGPYNFSVLVSKPSISSRPAIVFSILTGPLNCFDCSDCTPSIEIVIDSVDCYSRDDNWYCRYYVHSEVEMPCEDMVVSKVSWNNAEGENYVYDFKSSFVDYKKTLCVEIETSYLPAGTKCTYKVCRPVSCNQGECPSICQLEPPTPGTIETKHLGIEETNNREYCLYEAKIPGATDISWLVSYYFNNGVNSSYFAGSGPSVDLRILLYPEIRKIGLSGIAYDNRGCVMAVRGVELDCGDYNQKPAEPLLSISPNPVIDRFTIYSEPELEGNEYLICTPYGKPVRKGILNGANDVNVAGLEPGTYLLKSGYTHLFFVVM